jgi:class 3 adenylate cyclase
MARQARARPYTQAFADNGVELDHLTHLTDDDLKELGLPLGPRRQLQAAVQSLFANQPPIRRSTPSAHAAGARPAEAERRQLTVLFCDLVGSTELTARLDPEEMGQVLRDYQNVVAGEVTRFEGHVAKYMGDGVLAYFGYPRAHEDDAERAVRAGLALAEAVGRLATPAGEPIAARIGIATGLVVVGELIGDGAAHEQAVVGETPNLAARLQGLAAPGGIIISRRTRRLVGGLFEVADLGPQHLKGFAEPIRAWRVVGISAAENRFEAMHPSGVTPLVGRDHELGLLLDRWDLAKGREGQVVLLSGEPGIGKSSLAQAMHERLAAELHLRLRYHCSPYHVNSALFPVIGQLERAAGFRPEDTPEAKLDQLEAVLAEAADNLTEIAPLIAALLSLSAAKRYPPLNLTPEARKAKTLDALLGQVEGLAARRPVLMVLEDAHWMDPTTAELFGLVIDRIQRLPALVLITFRPEFKPPWTGHAHVMQLSLSRLTRRHGQALVDEVTGGKALPDEMLDQILAKTDGVPLSSRK